MVQPVVLRSQDGGRLVTGVSAVAVDREFGLDLSVASCRQRLSCSKQHELCTALGR